MIGKCIDIHFHIVVIDRYLHHLIRIVIIIRKHREPLCACVIDTKSGQEQRLKNVLRSDFPQNA